MGWTFIQKPSNVKDYIANDLLTWSNDLPTTYRVLDVKIVKMREAYAAVESVHKETGKRDVFAVIFLLDYRKDDYYDFGYKDMDETCGPYARNCPVSILNLLTETDNEHALEWRAACRKNAAHKAPTFGQKFTLKRALNFTDGKERKNFVVERHPFKPRTKMYRCLDTGALVSISGMKTREFTLIPE